MFYLITSGTVKHSTSMSLVYDDSLSIIASFTRINFSQMFKINLVVIPMSSDRYTVTDTPSDLIFTQLKHYFHINNCILYAYLCLAGTVSSARKHFISNNTIRITNQWVDSLCYYKGFYRYILYTLWCNDKRGPSS